MEIKRLLPKTFGANCYFVHNNKQSIIIDPSVSLEIIKRELGTNKLVGVLLTHGHFDHILGLEEVLDFYQVPLYLHSQAIEKIGDAKKNYSLLTGQKIALNLENYSVKTIKQSDELLIFDLPIKVYETPGHTNCSVCYLIDDNLFTGDTLFKGTVGRTDLYSGSQEILLNSLELLKSFPDNITVFPGHEEQTTILDEKLYNRYLR